MISWDSLLLLGLSRSSYAVLGTDISYTRGPDWLKKVPNYEHDKCSTFWALARLAYPDDRNKNLGNTLPSPVHKTVLEPDEHMLCYDYLYYACADQVRSIGNFPDCGTGSLSVLMPGI